MLCASIDHFFPRAFLHRMAPCVVRLGLLHVIVSINRWTPQPSYQAYLEMTYSEQYI